MTWPEFHHEAMATDFSITIADHPPGYARQAAAAAWRELDQLEAELSRFIESSDIARANRLARGETISIGDATLECLLVAAQVSVATDGAFDPAYASERDDTSPPFTLDPETHTLTSHARRLHLDLGAIGKGFALDRLAAVLRDWEIASACLQSGGSTALLLAAPNGESGWSVGIGEATTYRTLSLANSSLSGSGIAVKGSHLIDPARRTAAARDTRVWALAPTAALSDALSTAFFVMPDDRIAHFCSLQPEIGAAIAPAETTSPARLIAHGALRPLLS
jgi:thiamine biosynthesis lipoprotein